MPRPDSFRTQIPVQCCGKCKFAENFSTNDTTEILCFRGDNVVIEREIKSGELFPIIKITLDGVDLDEVCAEDVGDLLLDRLVGFHDVCDQFEANDAET